MNHKGAGKVVWVVVTALLALIVLLFLVSAFSSSYVPLADLVNEVEADNKFCVDVAKEISEKEGKSYSYSLLRNSFFGGCKNEAITQGGIENPKKGVDYYEVNSLERTQGFGCCIYKGESTSGVGGSSALPTSVEVIECDVALGGQDATAKLSESGVLYTFKFFNQYPQFIVNFNSQDYRIPEQAELVNNLLSSKSSSIKNIITTLQTELRNNYEGRYEYVCKKEFVIPDDPTINELYGDEYSVGVFCDVSESDLQVIASFYPKDDSSLSEAQKNARRAVIYDLDKGMVLIPIPKSEKYNEFQRDMIQVFALDIKEDGSYVSGGGDEYHFFQDGLLRYSEKLTPKYAMFRYPHAIDISQDDLPWSELSEEGYDVRKELFWPGNEPNPLVGYYFGRGLPSNLVQSPHQEVSRFLTGLTTNARTDAQFISKAREFFGCN